MSNLMSLNEFRRVLDSCGATISPDAVSRHHRILTDNLARAGGITNRTELAMFLANIMHESGCLRYTREINPAGYWFNGKNYYGRGYIQLTHHYNYEAASKALFHDDRLLQNPELVADDELVAWSTALWFWKDRVRPNLARLGSENFDATIKAINSMELAPTASDLQRQQVAKRRKLYDTIRAVLNGDGGAAGRPESGAIVYIVKPGDTLSAIAQRHGTTVAKIAGDNGLSNPNAIYPNQQLHINR